MRARRTSAFTLLELMVVITIIVVLAGVLVVGISSAFGRAGEHETKTMIDTLSAGVGRFETRYRFYPPSSISRLSTFFGAAPPEFDPNETNMGIEAVVMALRTRRNGGPFLDNALLAQRTSNTDSDEVITNFTNVEGEIKLFEIRDYWENPLVYVNLDDLNPARNPNAAGSIYIVGKNGGQQAIQLAELNTALIDSETGVVRAKGYAIWSFGPDGINDYGNGDDIASWQ